MRQGRIASVVVLVWSGACFALAAVIFVNLRRIDSPERYIALVLGLVLLYMGGSMLAGLLWPPKPKDPNAPIVVPPLDQVRGRTSYRDVSAFALLRQIRTGRARLELDAPARRGDTMSGVITAPGGDVNATVELLAIRSFGSRGVSRSAIVARSSASTSATRNGNDVAIRFTAPIPLIDTSEGRFSWNVRLETREPKHRATFLIDVA